MENHSSILAWRIPWTEESSMDREAWWATVHGVAKNQTQLSDCHFHFLSLFFVGTNHVSPCQIKSLVSKKDCFLFSGPNPTSLVSCMQQEISQYLLVVILVQSRDLTGGSDVKESAYSAGDPVQSLGWEGPLEKGMTAYSNILAWRIPWTEKPGRPQSTGLQRIGHD